MRLLNRLWLNYASGGYIYQAETVTLLRSLTGTYSTARKIEIDKMIKSLKAAGIWSKLDVLQMYAAPTAADAVVNWKSPGTFNATLVNSPTLEADRGIAGDGASSRIDTGVNFGTITGNFTLNSASFGLYIRSEVNIGTHGGSRNLIAPQTSGVYNGRINDGTGTSYAVASSLGLSVLNRTNDLKKLYRNGQEGASATVVASAPNNLVIPIGAYGDGTTYTYNSHQTTMFFSGASLDATQHSALYTALETYLDYIGAGVIA